MRRIGKNNKGLLKRLNIALWVFPVTAYLYYFTMAMTPKVTFLNFINFAIVLWGGGYGYTLLMKLIKSDINIYNRKKWLSLLLSEGLTMFGFIISGASLYYGKSLGGSIGKSIAFLGLMVGMIFAYCSLTKAIQKINIL